MDGGMWRSRFLFRTDIWVTQHYFSKRLYSPCYTATWLLTYAK